MVTASPTPQAISAINDPDRIRITIYASNQPVHAPLTAAVEAGAGGRLLPPGGSKGEVLINAGGGEYDTKWSTVIGSRAYLRFDGATPEIIDQVGINAIIQDDTGEYTVKYLASVASGGSVTITAGDTQTPGIYTATLLESGTASFRFKVTDASGDPVDVDLICAHVFGRELGFFILSGDAQVDGLDKLSSSGDVATGVLLLTPSDA
jgi:hypothetical protein